MKTIALWGAIWTLLTLPGSASDLQSSPVLTGESREKIRILAGERSGLMEILVPEQVNAAQVPISSVPERARTRAGVWIPRVVQATWLPAEIESKLVALKDVKLWEKRNKNGILISEDVGDFLTLDYEVSGHVIHVQESGVTVSLRVDFPEIMPVADDPDAFIRQCLKAFLNIPADVVRQLAGEVKHESPLYVAFLRSPRALERHLALLRTHRVTPADSERWIREHQWWDYLSVCTDGRFFFVWVPEAEPGKRGPSRPGLPDRF